MSKETLATILGLAGLSLLKKVSGSANETELEHSLGFLWYKVKITDVSDSGYELNYYLSLVADFMYFAKKYALSSPYDILEDNGVAFDEDDEPIYPDSEKVSVREVIESNFGGFAETIDEWYAPVYHLDYSVFPKIIRVGSMIESLKEIPRKDDEFYIKVNVLEMLNQHNQGRIGVRGYPELTVDTISANILGELNLFRQMFDYYMYEIGEEVDTIVSIELVEPKKNIIMLTSLFRNNSELRKF